MKLWRSPLILTLMKKLLATLRAACAHRYSPFEANITSLLVTACQTS